MPAQYILKERKFMSIKGRANTIADKNQMIDVILQSWIKCPELRLGQLIVNAIRFAENPNVPLFYIEDSELESAIIEFSKNK